MTDLTEIEKAWCDWMRRFRGNRSGEPAPVASFKAGAAYECARIRRELLGSCPPAAWVADWLNDTLDRICPEEG